MWICRLYLRLYAQFYKEDGKSINLEVLVHFFETLKTENEDSWLKKIDSITESSSTSEGTLETSVEEDNSSTIAEE